MATGETWRFRKGDPVPAWMLDQEPVTAGAKAPRLTFGGDVIVVETDYAFWILVAGKPPGDAQINVDGRTDGTVRGFATNKPLVWASQVKMLGGPDDGDVDLGPITPRMPERV